MCENEIHYSLTQPEHYVRHAMKVEQACSLTRRGLGSVSLDAVMAEAQEALSLADTAVSPESMRMVELAAAGNLAEAAKV